VLSTPYGHQGPGHAEIGLLHIEQCPLTDSIIILGNAARFVDKWPPRLEREYHVLVEVLTSNCSGMISVSLLQTISYRVSPCAPRW
jgi:hypothetical protein